MARLHIDHLVPLTRGGTDDETNLWLACPICNGHKADKITETDPETGAVAPLFNPRAQAWSDYFHWAERGLHIIGYTAIGRATVVALQLDTDPDALVVIAALRRRVLCSPRASSAPYAIASL